MSCKHPFKAFRIGTRDNGKAELLVRPYAVDHLEYRNGHWLDCYIDFVSPYAQKVSRDWQEIPCGRCIGCRLEYSKQWANRCLLENEYHEDGHFITLTYDPEHVPKSYVADPSTGEAIEHLTLKKRDFQLFMKRLRKQTGQELRYFAAGEYGSKTFRPHYHAIIFGLKLDDLTVVKKSQLGYNYYTSPTVLRAWSVYEPPTDEQLALDPDAKGSYAPLGMIVVAPITWETCAYTARYTAKKNGTQGSEYFEAMNIEPPFTLMSRRPGIGAQWYLDHPDVFDHSFINVSTEDGGRKFRPPKYFYSLLEKENPAYAEQLKQKRKSLMDKYHVLKLRNTDLDYLDLLEVEEDALIQKTKSLERRL